MSALAEQGMHPLGKFAGGDGLAAGAEADQAVQLLDADSQAVHDGACRILDRFLTLTGHRFTHRLERIAGRPERQGRRPIGAERLDVDGLETSVRIALDPLGDFPDELGTVFGRQDFARRPNRRRPFNKASSRLRHQHLVLWLWRLFAPRNMDLVSNIL